MWIVVTSSAKPVSSGGYSFSYTNVALVELSQEYTAHNWRPKMISERARGVLSVVHYGKWPSGGRTRRSGLQQAITRANEAAREANNASDMATAAQIIGAGGSA